MSVCLSVCICTAAKFAIRDSPFAFVPSFAPLPSPSLSLSSEFQSSQKRAKGLNADRDRSMDLLPPTDRPLLSHSHPISPPRFGNEACMAKTFINVSDESIPIMLHNMCLCGGRWVFFYLRGLENRQNESRREKSPFTLLMTQLIRKDNHQFIMLSIA